MILVTGATGNIGRNVVHCLHREGRRVRALSRHARPADFPAGVDVIAGDMTDPAVLKTALEGVEAAFLFPLFGRITPFLDAASDRGLERVVMLSSSTVTFDEPGWIGHQHRLLEDEVRATGLTASFVRPDVFMANDLAWAAEIRSSRTVRLAYPDAATAPVDERDIAALAAHALTETTVAAAYEITGPESLTQADRVDIAASVLGHPIELVELSHDEAVAEHGRVMPTEAAEFLVDTLRSQVGNTAVTTDTLREVAGRPPHSYAEWVAHHRDDFSPR